MESHGPGPIVGSQVGGRLACLWSMLRHVVEHLIGHSILWPWGGTAHVHGLPIQSLGARRQQARYHDRSSSSSGHCTRPLLMVCLKLQQRVGQQMCTEGWAPRHMYARWQLQSLPLSQ